MFFSRWSFVGAILVLAAGPLAAQEVKVRTIGAGLDESILWINPADASSNLRESFRGVLISDKGEILTTWRNVCISGKLRAGLAHSTVSLTLIGVHPTRDLALLQADMSGVVNKPKVKPAKLAGSAIGLGDQVMLWRHQQPVPAIVSSETQPVDHPEYFWISGQDKSNPASTSGWGYQPPQPDDWVLNLKGEIQGLLARVLVNGTMTLRVIPLHDIPVEEFIAPSKRRTDPAKAKDLLQIAENIERNRYKPGGGQKFVPFAWNGSSTDYLRMALVEDPTNKDVLFKMGLTVDDVKSSATDRAAGTAEPRKTPDPASGKGNEQIEAEFIRSRVNAAMELLKSNQLKIAEGILQDVVDTYPKHPEAKPAQRLLDVLKGKK